MMKTTSKVIVGLVGLGTVGSGVARILLKKRAALRLKTGIDFRLKTVCVANRGKKRSIPLGGVRLTTSVGEILNDPEITQVVELIGGINPAHRIVRSALVRGKDVISANKALFAEKGHGLHALAEKRGRFIGLEASVAGGIPIIKALKEGLASNRVQMITGILNGTCNSILTEMSEHDRTYAEALRNAQAKGFAEKDPALDVDGTDTAHKLAILARIAFQKEIRFGRIHREGIERLSPVDIFYARQMGYVLKLLAVARRDGDFLELRVHPALLEKNHPLATVNGVYNAVLVRGDEVEDVLFYGKGAGQRPTASAVLSDMIDIARLRRLGIRPHVTRLAPAKVKPISELESRYYLRFFVRDRTGTLGRLTVVLGKCGISISSVHQIESSNANSVPVVMLTHRAPEKNLQRAVRLIDASSVIRQKTVVIRIESARH